MAPVLQRWHATSTLTYSTRQQYYGFLPQNGEVADAGTSRVRSAGGLDARSLPRPLSPSWTGNGSVTDRAGQSQKDREGQGRATGWARYKTHVLAALRAFFLDCQEWGWIPRRFDPRRVLATPRSIRTLIGPNPQCHQATTSGRNCSMRASISRRMTSRPGRVHATRPAEAPGRLPVGDGARDDYRLALLWIRSDEWSRYGWDVCVGNERTS